jgi:hypothetical protein
VFEAETAQGFGVAHGSAWPSEEGRSPGRSGPAWRPRLTGLADWAEI